MAAELTEWRPLTEMRHRIDQIFRDIGDGFSRGWTPSVDVVRTDEAIVLRADLPGIKTDEVKMRRERRYGSFSRSMSLPPGVKADEIEATTEDGVLEVKIPIPEAEKKRSVEIKPTPKGE